MLKAYHIWPGIKKIIQGSSLFLIAVVMCAGAVSAHVTVHPQEVTSGYSVVTVRVPNEKDIATTKVRVLVPDGVEVHGVMPINGWRHSEIFETDKAVSVPRARENDGDAHDDTGRISEIIWSGRINAGEFMDFPISVKYPAGVDKVTWKTYQTYAGDQVVPWDDSDDGHPGAVVSVLEESRMDTLEKIVQKSERMPPVKQDPWMPVVALLVSAIALAISIKRT